jgi:hypothetical protein
MACQGCINRQRMLVKRLCKKPDSPLCRKAQARLQRMTASKTEEQKNGTETRV